MVSDTYEHIYKSDSDWESQAKKSNTNFQHQISTIECTKPIMSLKYIFISRSLTFTKFERSPSQRHQNQVLTNSDGLKISQITNNKEFIYYININIVYGNSI